MKYKLLAIDIDGTLVTPDQKVPADTVSAIAAAQEAGMDVCLATGRSLAESMPAWRQLPLQRPYQPMVCVGGAMVADPETGRTLYHRTIPRELAVEFGAALAAKGYSACAFVDGWRHGVDYYLGENGDGEVTQKVWFSKMNVRVRRGETLGHLTDMPRPLRINAIVAPDAAETLCEDLKRQFAGRLIIHSLRAPNYGVVVVECFSPLADKWSGVAYVAQGRHIARNEIAAVGDDVNDLAMITGAGLGVAMPNASEAIREKAKHVAAEGLGVFIRQLVAGKFDA